MLMVQIRLFKPRLSQVSHIFRILLKAFVGLSRGLHINNFEKQSCWSIGVSEFYLTWTAGLERSSKRLLEDRTYSFANFKLLTHYFVKYSLVSLKKLLIVNKICFLYRCTYILFLFHQHLSSVLVHPMLLCYRTWKVHHTAMQALNSVFQMQWTFTHDQIHMT